MIDRVLSNEQQWTIEQGHVIDVLKKIPDNVIHTVVTSPPYWALRQYLFNGAVILRRDLDDETRQRVIEELARRGISTSG